MTSSSGVLPNHRLLLVHAHPDDETIGSGATMAKYVSAGAQVTLVTCTLGEEGEILVPELAHLAADQSAELGTVQKVFHTQIGQPTENGVSASVKGSYHAIYFLCWKKRL